MKTAEEILREYIQFDDVNGSKTVRMLPLTITDAMEEYAEQFKKARKVSLESLKDILDKSEKDGTLEEEAKRMNPSPVEWFYQKIKHHFIDDEYKFEFVTFAMAMAKERERKAYHAEYEMWWMLKKINNIMRKSVKDALFEEQGEKIMKILNEWEAKY